MLRRPCPKYALPPDPVSQIMTAEDMRNALDEVEARRMINQVMVYTHGKRPSFEWELEPYDEEDRLRPRYGTGLGEDQEGAPVERQRRSVQEDLDAARDADAVRTYMFVTKQIRKDTTLHDIQQALEQAVRETPYYQNNSRYPCIDWKIS